MVPAGANQWKHIFRFSKLAHEVHYRSLLVAAHPAALLIPWGQPILPRGPHASPMPQDLAKGNALAASLLPI